MATQHPGLKRIGEYWHFSLKINGQRLHGSTRAKDLATAKRVMEERRKELLLNQCGAPKIPTLVALVERWLNTHKAVHMELAKVAHSPRKTRDLLIRMHQRRERMCEARVMAIVRERSLIDTSDLQNAEADFHNAVIDLRALKL
ncbi:MAG: hypothetical protein HY014_07600 [Acidobacteria bacterium]|nr:hypothetical protein [Acidobacteriota bacterium]MBI1856515.1 hypothetical protein [Chloroflexota bacterium]MBI3488017.1 hypothetical protein [Acidobacteriota bacterium]